MIFALKYIVLSQDVLNQDNDRKLPTRPEIVNTVKVFMREEPV